MELREALETDTVAHVGYQDLVAVQEEQTVRAAVERMREKKTGCLLILKGERLTGIFTERDLITRVLGTEGAYDAAITTFMTAAPTVALANEPIHLVLARMHTGGMRHLPVLDSEGRPVGTISVRSVVHFLADHHPTTVYNLPPDHNLIPSTREGG